MATLLKNPLFFYVRLFPGYFWAGLFFLALTNALDAAYPLLLKRGLDQIEQKSSYQEVLATAGLFFLLMSFLAISRYAWRHFFNAYHIEAGEHLRRTLFEKLIRLGPRYYNSKQIGDLMSHLVNDISAFSQAIGSGILILVDGALLVLFIVPLMISLNPTWTWQTLIFIPALPFVIQFVAKKIFIHYKLEQDSLSVLSGFTQESVSGIRVLKSFVREDHRLALYKKISTDYSKISNKTAFYDSLFGPIMEFSVAVGTVILIFISAPSLLSGAVSIGTFVAFQRFITKMVWPMTAFGYGFSTYRKGMASFARIREILETPDDLPDLGASEINQFSELEFKNVTLEIDNKRVLDQISFIVKRGERVGIVGPVGSGKSLLAALIPRLWETASHGEILINGAPIRTFRLSSLRKCFHLVNQEPTLFSMSIADNLDLTGQLHDREQKESFLDLVHISRELRELPQGIDTLLGERGVNLSGGQKQRLALARGLAANPEVLILDDVLSAVDQETEAKLIQTLKSWNKTLILITHRIEVLKDFDRIYVMNLGRLDAVGDWQKLFSENEFFKDLIEKQNLNPKGQA